MARIETGALIAANVRLQHQIYVAVEALKLYADGSLPTQPQIAQQALEDINSQHKFLTPDQLRYVVEGIGTYAWNNGFYEFCQLLGFDLSTSYAMGKWEDFQLMVKGVNALDLEKLMKIVEVGHQ